MSQPLHEPSAGKTAWTDSPWLWATSFCVAGLLCVLLIAPKYAARQRRLEMQYQARQEIERRQAQGTSESREPGSEGDAPPPALGELIIPLWPIAVLLGVLALASGGMWWRSTHLAPPRRGLASDPAAARGEGDSR